MNAAVPAMQLDFCTPRMLRVRLGGPGNASYEPRAEWAPVASTRTPGPPERIQTGAMTVDVTPADLTLFDAAGMPRLRLALDQSLIAPSLRLRLEFLGEQHFYGLGEGGAQFDRLGIVRRLWNFQANRGQGADIAMPLLLSTAGYGVFFDSSERATVEPGDAADGAWIEYRAAAGPIDLYLISGDMRTVLGEAAQLLGPAALPPRWALGYLQSSRHFNDADELRALATEFRRRRIPCDALIFLSTYGTARGWNRGVGHLDFEPTLFAQAASIIAEFRAENFQVVSHEYPVLHPHSPLFAEAESQGYLLDFAYPHLPAKPGAAIYKEGQRMLDFSRAEVREWWWQQHRALVALGVAGWWLDGGEGPPEHVALQGGPSRTLHNRFDLLRQQAFAVGEARDRPHQRPYLLCRSGGPGMQRFGAMPWSGDINTTFATLETQIRTGLNVGLSGVPHWGTDAGGFYSVAPDDGELFVRWLQFAAFTSIFRGHGHVWRRHVPWAYGERIETICRAMIELRYRLMPYTYTLAWQAHRTGLPLMRPLVLNYPHDPKTWDLGTQYLWGDDLLVAPVTREGATHWTVYLPEGVWHDYWTHAAYQGPCGVTVEAPLERLPLFVRGGAIVPMGPVMQYAGERTLDELTLLIYPRGESVFTLYEDDGETNAWRDGVHVLTNISCTESETGCVIEVDEPRGDAAMIPGNRLYVLRIRAHRTPQTITVDGAGALPRGESAAGSAWWMDGDFAVARVAGNGRTLRVVW